MKNKSQNSRKSHYLMSGYFLLVWLIVWAGSSIFPLFATFHLLNLQNKTRLERLQQFFLPVMSHYLKEHELSKCQSLLDRLQHMEVINYYSVLIKENEKGISLESLSSLPEDANIIYFPLRFVRDGENCSALATLALSKITFSDFLAKNFPIILSIVMFMGLFWFLILYRLMQLSLITPLKQLTALTDRLILEDVEIPQPKFHRKFDAFFHRYSRKLFENVALIGGLLKTYRSKEQFAREKLAETEENLQLLAETARDIILIHDMEGNILYVNESGLKFAGFSKNELANKKISDIIPSDYVQAMMERKSKRMQGDDKKYLYEIEFVDREGKRIPVEVSSSPYLRDGKVVGVFVVARDISERKKAEAALAKYRDHLEELIQKRTAELEEKNHELERMNELFIGREFRIKELKDKIKLLKEEIERLKKKIY